MQSDDIRTIFTVCTWDKGFRSALAITIHYAKSPFTVPRYFYPSSAQLPSLYKDVLQPPLLLFHKQTNNSTQHPNLHIQQPNNLKSNKMSFHLSAKDIRIEDGHLIRAMLRNDAGEMCFSEVDLDVHIGNENGPSFILQSSSHPFLHPTYLPPPITIRSIS